MFKNTFLFSYLKKRRHVDGGFTIIETLVALLIFSVSVAAMIFVVSHGVSDTTYSKNKLVASYLSQEGIELVRYVRDSEVLREATVGAGWTAFATDIQSCSTPCNTDPAGIFTTFTDVLVGGKSGLEYSASGGYIPSGSATVFNRVITFDDTLQDRLKVTSTVAWRQGTTNYSVSASEILFNWPLK